MKTDILLLALLAVLLDSTPAVADGVSPPVSLLLAIPCLAMGIIGLAMYFSYRIYYKLDNPDQNNYKIKFYDHYEDDSYEMAEKSKKACEYSRTAKFSFMLAIMLLMLSVYEEDCQSRSKTARLHNRNTPEIIRFHNRSNFCLSINDAIRSFRYRKNKFPRDLHELKQNTENIQDKLIDPLTNVSDWEVRSYCNQDEWYRTAIIPYYPSLPLWNPEAQFMKWPRKNFIPDFRVVNFIDDQITEKSKWMKYSYNGQDFFYISSTDILDEVIPVWHQSSIDGIIEVRPRKVPEEDKILQHIREMQSEY